MGRQCPIKRMLERDQARAAFTVRHPCLDKKAMEEFVMLEIVPAKELVDLLKGFEDVFVHISSFPDLQ